MGHQRHDALVATSYGLPEQVARVQAAFDRCRENAVQIGTEPALVVGPVPAPLNGYVSWAVLPDGSKTGWSDDEAWDRLRDALIRELRETGCDFAYVRFGGDDGPAEIRADDTTQ